MGIPFGAKALNANSRAFAELRSTDAQTSKHILNPLSHPDLLDGNPRESGRHVAASSPFQVSAGARQERSLSAVEESSSTGSSTLQVCILNGVSGEEEARFSIPVDECFSEQQLLAKLDQLCRLHIGQALQHLNWLNPKPGGRFERCTYDSNMVEEFL